MFARRGWIALLVGCYGCVSPAPPTSTVKASALAVPALASAKPPERVNAIVAPPTSSTPPNSSASSTSSSASSTSSAWRCQPGYRCFDGCNWGACDPTGTFFTRTDLSCDLSFAIRFEAGTSEPEGSSLSPHLHDSLKKRLRNPQRRLRLVGYAGETEAASDAHRRQLAQRRAERVQKLLINEGISAQRLAVEVGDVRELDSAELGQRLVILRDDPPGPVRSDFEPSSPEYLHFCGARE